MRIIYSVITKESYYFLLTSFFIFLLVRFISACHVNLNYFSGSKICLRIWKDGNDVILITFQLVAVIQTRGQASWSSGKFSHCALRGLGFMSDRGPGQADSAFHSENGVK